MVDIYKGEYFNLFKSVFNDVNNGICIVDYSGKLVEVNKSFSDMFGYNKNELIGKYYTSLVTEDYLTLVKNNHKKVLNGVSLLKADEKVKHKNGTLFYIQSTNIQFNDESGNRLRFTTAVDITNRLKNELVQSVLLKISNLTNLNIPSEQLYTSIHEALCELKPINNIAICIKNSFTNKLEFPYIKNEYEIDAIKSLEFEYKLIENAQQSVILNNHLMDKLINNNQLTTYKHVPKSFLGTPLFSKNEFLGSVVIKDYLNGNYTNEDKELFELVAGQIARVIERKNYEDKLVNAKIKAEEAVKIKAEFLAQISHEIRTPLNAILSFSSLLKNELNGGLTPELSETFQYIENGGNRLIRTIDLILNASKSQNNKYKIKLEEVDLNNDVLKPIIKSMKDKADKKNISIDLHIAENHLRIVCDQYSISQLFENLIENAIKYTPKGSVKVSAYINSIGKLQVDIIDTGIGIAPEYLPKLFEPFTQEEQGYTRSYEGLGLGLSLVKNYADLNNAEIKVESEKDKGSVFSIIFN